MVIRCCIRIKYSGQLQLVEVLVCSVFGWHYQNHVFFMIFPRKSQLAISLKCSILRSKFRKWTDRNRVGYPRVYGYGNRVGYRRVLKYHQDPPVPFGVWMLGGERCIGQVWMLLFGSRLSCFLFFFFIFLQDIQAKSEYVLEV